MIVQQPIQLLVSITFDSFAASEHMCIYVCLYLIDYANQLQVAASLLPFVAQKVPTGRQICYRYRSQVCLQTGR